MIFEDCEKNYEMGIKGKQMYYKKTSYGNFVI